MYDWRWERVLEGKYGRHFKSIGRVINNIHRIHKRKRKKEAKKEKEKATTATL